MQLIEGQMFVFFFMKRRQIRSNKFRIESARVRGSNKDGRELMNEPSYSTELLKYIACMCFRH